MPGRTGRVVSFRKNMKLFPLTRELPMCGERVFFVAKSTCRCRRRVYFVILTNSQDGLIVQCAFSRMAWRGEQKIPKSVPIVDEPKQFCKLKDIYPLQKSTYRKKRKN